MNPVQLAETVRDLILNDFPQGGTLAPECALDPELVLDHDEFRCFIIPDLVMYDLGSSEGRARLVSIASTKFVSVVLATTFQSLNKGPDLAKWDEAKAILQIRYDLDEFLIKLNIDGYKIGTFDVNLPDEIQAQFRNFVSVTSIGFEMRECGTPPEQSLSLRSLRGGSSMRRTRG